MAQSKNAAAFSLQNYIWCRANKTDGYRKTFSESISGTGFFTKTAEILTEPFSKMMKEIFLRREYGGRQGILVEGKDYSVSYKNNVKAADSTDSKAPTVIIKGNYKGTVTKTFTITEKRLDDKDVFVTLLVSNMPYTGKAGKYISAPVLVGADGMKL